MKRFLLLMVILILRPHLLDFAAIIVRLSRAVLARMVLDSWIVFGNSYGRITKHAHRWLRNEANGKTKAEVERWFIKLDLPDTQEDS